MSLDHEFYEIRDYSIAPGRINDMRSRLRNDLCPLFDKHGIRMQHCWDTGFDEACSRFVYLLRWGSWAERTDAWASFYADPNWHSARARTNAGSDLVTRMKINMLRRFYHSSRPARSEHLHMYLLRFEIGQGAAAQNVVVEDMASQLQRWQCSLYDAYELLTGDDLPQMLLTVETETPEETASAIQNVLLKPILGVTHINVVPLCIAVCVTQISMS